MRLDSAERDADVIQLLVNQHIGGHSGYSGSPVVDLEGRVIGVLVEQITPRDLRTSSSPTDVLYAVPIRDVVQRFDLGSTSAPSIELTPVEHAQDSHMRQTPWARQGHWRRCPLPHPVRTEINLLAFSPLDTLVTGGSDGTLRLWDSSAEPRVTRSISHANTLRRLTFSGDGDLFATLSGDQARVWASKPTPIRSGHAHRQHTPSTWHCIPLADSSPWHVGRRFPDCRHDHRSGIAFG